MQPLTSPVHNPGEFGDGAARAIGNDRDPTLPPSLPEVILRFARRASIAGLSLSLIIHAVLWLIAAMVVIGGTHGDGTGSGEPGGPIEMAVVTEGELSQLQ